MVQTHKKIILSLGAGVQSSTMALMAAKGELPMPDCAIFADTQAEPKKVYDWLNWLEKQLPYPIHRVTGGNLTEQSLKLRKSSKTGKHYMKHNVPAFTLGDDGKKGIKQRQCTYDFKIIPIKRKVRSLLEKKQQATVWIGISLDEVVRMKPSRVGYITHEWPLIDKRMTRASCFSWMKKNGYPTPPRSACIYCPFHSKAEWKALTKDEMQQAIDYEKKLQEGFDKVEKMNSKPFLHNSRVPLENVDFDTEEPDLFNNECEGMCGV